MNGQWLGSRSIRTNWATRKPPASKTDRKFKMYKYFVKLPLFGTDLMIFLIG